MENPIFSRRSIRKFKKDSFVPIKTLEELVKAGMAAPSANNNRPWEFIIITQKAIIDSIQKILPNAIACKTAPALIVLVSVPNKLYPMYYVQECGAAVQNILLQAQILKLGACWCGVWPNETRIENVRRLLDISIEKVPFCIIAIGEAAIIPQPRTEVNIAEKTIYIV